MCGETNNFVHDEVLNDDTLIEVTTNHVSSNTDTQTTESTVPIFSLRLDTSTLANAPLVPRRSTSPLHTPSYLKDYTYTIPNLSSSISTSD